MNWEARIEAVRGQMAAESIDLLLVASNGLHTLDRPDAVVHLSGYRSLGESVFLLYRDGGTVLIVSPAADAERVAAQYTASVPVATDDLESVLEAELSKPKNALGCVAIAGIDSLPYRLAERLLALVGRQARPFDKSLYRIHGCKTATEIDRARQATAIAEKGFDHLFNLAHIGMTECQLAVELNCYTKSLGADDNFLMLSASPHSAAVMPSSARMIARGDILLAEFTPCFYGQFSQICRTVSMGTPSSKLQEKYDLVVRAMWAGIEAVRPGIPVHQVCRAIDRVLQAAGYAEYCRPPHMRRRGHGLGCGSMAPGDIAADNETILEENMFFVVHPNQYIPEVGYLLCGEPVRVTATGVETLSSHTAALGIVAAGQTGFAPCA
jgi:Xaa-Pro dipeptidase